MTTLCLVRHGETDWNVKGIIQGQTDIPLNKLGEKQAKQCGRYLKGQNFNVIISSPLKRAKHSAKLINEYLDLPLIFNDNLKERYFGIAEGKTKELLIKQFPEKIYPEQETRLALNKRVMTALNTIIKTYPNQKVLIIAHGAVINSILSSVSNHVSGSQITTLKNGSFTTLKINDPLWLIELANCTSHLENKDNTIT